MQQTALQTALLILSIAIAGYAYGWQSLLSTATLTMLSYVIAFVIKPKSGFRRLFGYILFFLTPFLTYIGVLNTLTGLNPSGAEKYWFGITFVSASLAVFVYEGNLSLRTSVLHILQPIRLYSGPVAIPRSWSGHRRVTAMKLLIYGSWLNLGMFFFLVLAPTVTPFFSLKNSTNPVDTLVFATAYELYVYFNFAGISFMAYALLRAAGVAAMLNFNTPFAARSAIEYWQRWHISLSQVCKVLFFSPTRRHLGIPIAVVGVFVSSAMWHGTTLNFLIWGIFHATGWIGSYFLLSRCRYGKAIALAILPLLLVIGRLIFSEIDGHLLFVKLVNIMEMDLSAPLHLKEVALSKTGSLLLAVSIAAIAGEVARLPLFRRYRIYRMGWNSIFLLALTALFGVSGMGGIYGAR